MPEMNLDELRLDGGTQARAEMNQATIADYAEAIKAGDTFPPIVAMFDGKTHWVVEGFHRWYAFKAAGKHRVPVLVRRGSHEAAIVAACAANATHGLQRTHADKVKALKMLMETAPGKKMSEADLATHLHIPRPTIHYLKGELVKLTNEASISKENEGSSHETAREPRTNERGETQEEFNARANPPMPSKPPAPPEDPKDSVGQVIPERLRGVFARRQEINALLTQMSAVKTAVLKSAEAGDVLYWDFHATHFEAQMEMAFHDLSACIPHAVCPYCRGKGGRCKSCGATASHEGFGWLPKLRWQAVPKEIKDKCK